jgi:hypothetical protein
MTPLLVLLLLFTALALAAVRWGADSRDGRDWQPLEDPAGPPPAPRSSPVRAARRTLANAWAEHEELQERMALLNRPWEETFLHWSGEGPDRQLHGSVPPPRADRRYSVTRGGWCPGSGQPSERGTIGA